MRTSGHDSSGDDPRYDVPGSQHGDTPIDDDADSRHGEGARPEHVADEDVDEDDDAGERGPGSPVP